MRQRHSLPTTLLATVLGLALTLSAGPAIAGWGEALKAAGKAGAEAAGLSTASAKAESAVKEVLTLGKDSAIENLGKSGGFSNNVYAAISLPNSLSGLAAQSGLTSIINSAAESAVPALDSAFDQTIQGLDLNDPTSLLSAAKSSTGITDYFETQSRSTLKELAAPIIKKALENAGLSSYATALSAISKATGFDPVGYTTDKTLDAMFHYMGKEESSLRQTGGEGASSLLKQLL